MPKLKQCYQFSVPIILLILLDACSSKSAKFIPLEPGVNSTSIIYIYRPASLSNAIISPELIINGKPHLKISNNHYLRVNKDEGIHRFQLKLSARYTGKSELNLEVEPGKTYFLRVSTSLAFKKNQPYTRRFNIEQVNSAIAINEMQSLINTQEKDKPDRNPQIKPATEPNRNHQFSIDKSRNPFSG